MYIGFLFVNVQYATVFLQFVHVILALFLMWKFHPFKSRYVMNRGDPDIIFFAACFMFSGAVVYFIGDYIKSGTVSVAGASSFITNLTN